MSSGEMKISDILKYSIKIEHESMLFYKGAAGLVTEEGVKALLAELEAEEVKHETRLVGILDSTTDSDAEGFDHTSLDKLIQNREIPSGAGALAILAVALEREEHTRDFYRQVSTMTNLAANVIDLFVMLFKQESGHVTRIKNKIEKL
jgi:rubrerythrin